MGAEAKYADDFAAAGVPIAERWTRLDESIDLLRRFWSGEAVTHAGRHFHYEGLRIQPPPAQPGGPPIVVTGRQAGAMRRAALRGDGWMPYLYSAERYARSVATIKEVADEGGRNLDDFRWMTYVMVAVDDDPAAARRAAAEFLGGTYDQDFTSFVDRVAVTGNLDQVVSGLRAFAEAGAGHLVLLPCASVHSHAVAPWLADLVAELDAATPPPLAEIGSGRVAQPCRCRKPWRIAWVSSSTIASRDGCLVPKKGERNAAMPAIIATVE